MKGAGLPAVSLALLLVAGLGCAERGGPLGRDLAGRKVRAVTTTGHVADLVRNVGGDRVEVVGLMGPGVDPHLYRASERDVARLAEADVVFYNGLHLEGKLGALFAEMARRRPTVAVTDCMPRERLREAPEFQGQYDPHVWFDVALWKLAADCVERALVRLDPAHGSLYVANADRHRREMDDLHAWVQAEIRSIPRERRVLVTAHDAFGYLGRQYGLEVVGLQGISTETEAGIEDVRALARLVAERGVKAIFVESSVPRRTVEAVQAAARAMGREVAIGGELYSDALGEPGTPEGTYIGMVRHNVGAIVRALR